jgi:hypothetical protein
VPKRKKRAAIAAIRSSNIGGEHDLTRHDMTLRIALVRYLEPELGDANGHGFPEMEPSEYSVWRRVRCSGGLNLRVFHDRVLGPAMGWTRNYHAYFFTDLSDGAQFGPEGSGAVDARHTNASRYCSCLPDTDTTLGDLLRQAASRLLYCYNYKDRWIHIVTLDEIHSAADSTGACRVLDGRCACPPEDSQGFNRNGSYGYQYDGASFVIAFIRFIERLCCFVNPFFFCFL